MSFFDDAGAWFDQAGKDAGQGFKDVTKAVFHDGPKDVMNEIATGDVMQGIWNAQDDFSQVVYDVFNPNNGPSADEIVDQIESTIGQQPTPDYVVGPDFNEPAPALPSPITGPDFNEPAPALPSPITGPDFNEPAPALPSPITGPDFNEPAPALPSPITGPDFNEPAPALPSPGFKTFDPLTNPNPGLSSAFEFSEVGFDAVGINSNIGPDVTTIEELPGLVGGCGYDSIDSMNESLMDSMNSIFEVADIPMF